MANIHWVPGITTHYGMYWTSLPDKGRSHFCGVMVDREDPARNMPIGNAQNTAQIITTMGELIRRRHCEGNLIRNNVDMWTLIVDRFILQLTRVLGDSVGEDTWAASAYQRPDSPGSPHRALLWRKTGIGSENAAKHRLAQWYSTDSVHPIYRSITTLRTAVEELAEKLPFTPAGHRGHDLHYKPFVNQSVYLEHSPDEFGRDFYHLRFTLYSRTTHLSPYRSTEKVMRKRTARMLLWHNPNFEV